MLMLLAACRTDTTKTVFSKVINQTEILSYDSIFKSDTISFNFTNTSPDSALTFSFYKYGGTNYYSASTILASILLDSMSNEQKSIAIWKLTANSGFHYNYDYDHSLQDHVDPISLATFPYFMCGEKAGIIVNLANIAGLPARSVGLDGHVVAEIYYDSTWHMFDADENIILRNEKGIIQSVESLHKNPDLLQETNAEYGLKDNFHGFGNYKKYIKHYKAEWVDTTSLIHAYGFPNTGITLYPADKVSFKIFPTSWWDRIMHKRNTCSPLGILSRTIKQDQANTTVTDSKVIFTENFPYYTKELTISSSSPLSSKVYFQYRDRQTLKTEKKYLGQLNKGPLVQKFHAPVKPDIYYTYELIFENLDSADMGKIKIVHQFEFNPLTFPLNRNGRKVIDMGQSRSKNLLYEISNKD